jgi:hypothetical protein
VVAFFIILLIAAFLAIAAFSLSVLIKLLGGGAR